VCGRVDVNLKIKIIVLNLALSVNDLIPFEAVSIVAICVAISMDGDSSGMNTV
jgi:hypothetical protein